ncbi:nitrogen fixation protein NifZ [Sulfurimonas sp. HSL-1656]|uniref:nitrogen fixation protein NifZ n=1 Tax=Thiomicrolovo subterrani TaxID=3131934 RepID=UPI0031FA2165
MDENQMSTADSKMISPSKKDAILPVFRIGQRVKITKAIRNDGTNPFHPRDGILIEPGAEGYVTNIGDFLQVIRVYDVKFIEEGSTFGCREGELVAVEEEDGYDEVEDELRWIREHRAKREAEKLAKAAAEKEAAELAAKGAQSQDEGDIA